MAGRFRRTITFPEPKTDPACRAIVSAKRASYRGRSASLPVRFHPIISNLDDDVASLRSWSHSTPSSSHHRSFTSLLDGVDHISVTLVSLSDLLSHPQAAESLRISPFTDPFLDDLMRLADSYDSFRTSLINLTHLQSETQSALRCSDSSRLASALRAQRHAGKDIIRIASMAKVAVKTKPPPTPLEQSASPDSTDVAVLPVAFCDAARAIGAASAELISGLAALCNESIVPVALFIDTGGPVKLLKIWWVVDLLRWKSRAQKRAQERKEQSSVKLVKIWWVADLVRWKSRARKRAMERSKQGELEVRMERKMAMENLEVLENCIAALENGSVKVFRSLVNARVSVLNILTPSI
ncbi:hypothetical protein LUZ63_002850 [Rhynchospora breviuscula]|uniref:Uncharacterized protein n=1 Tax=Rhynchospora breviuscula TaxID=2022672 RepID=A0A9Q0CZL6_9POAL|nr:hypothetical protein LUZ63_002850 [Rhynchospora breviuscula]